MHVCLLPVVYDLTIFRYLVYLLSPQQSLDAKDDKAVSNDHMLVVLCHFTPCS